MRKDRLLASIKVSRNTGDRVQERLHLKAGFRPQSHGSWTAFTQEIMDYMTEKSTFDKCPHQNSCLAD